MKRREVAIWEWKEGPMYGIYKPAGQPKACVMHHSIKLLDARGLVWLAVSAADPRRQIGKRTAAYYTKVLKDLWLVKWGET